QERPRVHDQHGLAVRVTDVHQPVVQVAAVGRERRHAVGRAADHGRDQVDEREHQDGGGHQQRQQHAEPVDALDDRRLDRHHRDQRRGQHQPDQHRAGVAHEDLGRVEVVRQEAQARPDEHGGDGGGGGDAVTADVVAEVDGVGPGGHGGDADDAGRQPVEAVDEVDRVDRDHHHEDRDDGAQVVVEAGGAAPVLRQRDVREPQPVVDQDPGGGDLPGELDEGVHAPPVVQEAGHRDQAARHDQGQDRVAVVGGHRVARVGQVARHQQPTNSPPYIR